MVSLLKLWAKTTPNTTALEVLEKVAAIDAPVFGGPNQNLKFDL